MSDTLREWLVQLSELAVAFVDLLALVVLVAGTVEAFAGGMGLAFRRSGQAEARRQVWLTYSYWLIAGLTFQLSADIIETATAPSWDSIGQLAAIAVIRTFLNYFLERDQRELREGRTGVAGRHEA